MEIATGTLTTSLETLYAQQCALGFIRDDLSAVERYRYQKPEDRSRFFSIQYNPARALRFNGSGIKMPPPGEIIVNDGCFLCRDNICWQQQGLELGYHIRVNHASYIAWMNPYPLMPLHVVIAAKQHIPQSWSRDGVGAEHKDLADLLSDLVALSARLPGYIGFYNGVGAGASIPGHLHFQFFKRPEPHMLFPLEQAGGRAIADDCMVLDDYPLPALRWRCSMDSMLTSATRWIQDWSARNRAKGSRLSANIIATTSGSDRRLYFIPRDQLRSRSPKFDGMIGGLEVLGELVFSSSEEKYRLEAGEIDYYAIARILAAARVNSLDKV